MAAYQFSTPSAETLPPNLLENAATLCDVAQGAAAYQWLRNALLAAQSPCMELCSGEGSCYGLSSAAVHACNVDCARSMLDEPGVYASMGSCTSDYTACDLSGATGCCEQLSDCEPAAAAGVCERACEQGETYAGISYSVCLESCSASITESSGEFARRYCQASAISPETYTGCAGLDDNVTVPLECFLACDEEDMNAPCNALKGFACPLACTGLMSWKETAGSPLSSASCYMGLIGPSCDPGQVYTELASSICD